VELRDSRVVGSLSLAQLGDPVLDPGEALARRLRQVGQCRLRLCEFLPGGVERLPLGFKPEPEILQVVACVAQIRERRL